MYVDVLIKSVHSYLFKQEPPIIEIWPVAGISKTKLVNSYFGIFLDMLKTIGNGYWSFALQFNIGSEVFCKAFPAVFCNIFHVNAWMSLWNSPQFFSLPQNRPIGLSSLWLLLGIFTGLHCKMIFFLFIIINVFFKLLLFLNVFIKQIDGKPLISKNR